MFAVFRYIDDTVAHGRARHAIAHRFAVQTHLAAMHEVTFHDARDNFRHLGPARADETENAGHLPAEDREGGIPHDTRAGEVFNAQHLLAIGARFALARTVQCLGEIAADHRLDDGFPGEVSGVAGRHQFAVAEHRDPVGDLERLFQRMADEDDRHPLRLEPFDQRKKVPLLLGRQCGRRLVEDDDAGIVMHRTRNLDHLLLRRSERGDLCGRIDLKTHRDEKLARVDIEAAQPVEHLLVAEIDVLRHGHCGHQVGFLEHHRHPGTKPFGRRAETHFLAVEQHFP